MANFGAADIARLDRAYSTPQIVDQRRRIRAVVGARRSEVGLDVGCGPGHLACELAKEVAPGGRIFAIDKSPESVDATKARAVKEELTDSVDVQVGDANALEFPDDTFDFVVAAQVYSFVPNVAQAIEEAARVLRKGGRLMVLESDWDMCIWKSRDPIFTRRMISARAETQFAHAYLPRDLHKLFRAAGLTVADVDTFSIVETRYDPNSYGASVIGTTRDQALKHGLPAPDVAAWEQDLRSRTTEGEWFFCLNRFIFTGTK
jgi:ubiquinone/menaquinone biosynthesis C-methylase UbiE